mmetsp:Transcript_34640/g.52991  ORF Transcript_34640/g.52991 Transcript_34640/m.52991 type:complete len:141 (+) Transcript_34640:732-1154(+)
MFLTVFVYFYTCTEAAVKVYLLDTQIEEHTHRTPAKAATSPGGGAARAEVVSLWEPLLMTVPFFPAFPVLFSQSCGMYEGIPMLPSLFSNARNQERVTLVVTSNILIILMASFLISPLGILAYGDKLQEIVLLNLEYGPA